MTTPDTVEPGAAPKTADAPADAPAGTPADGTARPERRLHPMSWLFVLVQQLKQYIVPLLALLVFGRGDRNELWSLIGVAVLVLFSIWQYATYRYGVAGDRLIVRSGLFERSLRVIPFARIHNVGLRQSILHRLFGVAEVRLESAGGHKPEAEMRVLKLSDALALESLVRSRGVPVDGDAPAVPAEAATPLLALPLGEVLRLGLVSQRGLVLLGTIVAAMSQFSPRLLPGLMSDWSRALFGYAGSHAFGPAQYALAALSLFVLGMLGLRVLAIGMALLQFYGFRLDGRGRRLTAERGLLARWRTSVSRRRIQAWTLSEGLTHRLLGRRTLTIDTAVGEEGEDERGLRDLAPIATPATCDDLIERLLPNAGWNALHWQPLPGARAWRLFLPNVPWTLLVAAALSWRFGAWAALALLWLPWAAFLARQRVRRMAYAQNAALIALREGWWSRHWRFAELDKLQALQLTRSPMDRRCGTATLWLDTTGASALGPPLRLRFLPEDQARGLYERLAAELAQRELRW